MTLLLLWSVDDLAPRAATGLPQWKFRPLWLCIIEVLRLIVNHSEHAQIYVIGWANQNKCMENELNFMGDVNVPSVRRVQRSRLVRNAHRGLR